MPLNKYIKVLIGGEQVDLFDIEQLPLSISYKLEDPENFQNKKSSEVTNLVIPATIVNDKIANTFHNPGVDDNTPGQAHRTFKTGLIEANGFELFVGKALLTEASHDSLPVDYQFDMFGNNGDWILPLKETTLYDLTKHITFAFTKAVMEASWAFDGTSEALPYVFAPVRYGQPMDTMDGKLDYNMRVDYLRPALSVYWIIYWGLKSLGYKISSAFMDTNYFRRLVMPWTWGNFLFSEGTRLDELDFLVKSTTGYSASNTELNQFINLHIENETLNGAFDNNGVYEWDDANAMGTWTYIPGISFGVLDATFRAQFFVQGSVSSNAEVKLYAVWFLNGVQLPNNDVIIEIIAPAVTIGDISFAELVDVFRTIQVNEGDTVSLKIYADVKDSTFGVARFEIKVDEFGLEYLRIPLGGTIDFSTINGLKKYKFLDFLKGVFDCFNISPQSDPINKVVLMEPMHPYSLVQDQSEKTNGFFNGNHLDWSDKQDISKKSILPLFAESEREFIMKFRDDPNDGILKKIQDRSSAKLGAGKYVFPDRFKTGVKEYENSFFSPVMHWRPDQWGNVGTVPQMIVMIPENISNTSKDEAQNTFQPKLAWYKGVFEFGWVFDGEERSDFPWMFAVNYTTDGTNDPILSYGDEYVIDINDGPGPAPGLLRRFYLQRLAIQRNGQSYKTFFKLNNFDVANWFHREHIQCRGQKWELVEINNFKPLLEETTESFLRKHSPITEADSLAVFPSGNSVLTQETPTEPFDTKYQPMKCLYSDVKPQLE